MAPAQRRMVRLHGVAAMLVALVGGCSVLPSRSQTQVVAQAAAANPVSVAQLKVVGPDGRSGPARQRALLAGLSAQGQADDVRRHLAVLASLDSGDAPLHQGNDVDLLVDGPRTFAAMFEAIGQARRIIFLESYILEESSVADRLAELLQHKAEQGVHSYVLYDGVGSIGTSPEFVKRLQRSGAAVCTFNPVNPLERPGYWGIAHRDHRKILVVDGEVAFTGGINISDVYSSGSFAGRRKHAPQEVVRRQGWRDTQVRVRGSAAASFEHLVRQTWRSQGCSPELPPAPEAQPMRTGAAAPGDKVVQVIASSPPQPGPQPTQQVESPIYSSVLAALDTARLSAHFTMAYFAPGADMIDALCEAAQRGVAVVLILPSISDFSLILHAGRAHYDRLLSCGVQLHELEGAVLHAKTAVIDGVWSTVGSSNLDWRSFVANDEVNAVVLGRTFGGQMEAMFQRDLRDARQITPALWHDRPLLQRMKEWLASRVERWL